MTPMKKTNPYYFSVEGHTEKWYLEWLQKEINNSPESIYKVKFNCARESDPFSYSKRPSIIEKTEIFHLCDFESKEPTHVENFQKTIDKIILANKYNRVKYKLGYSNFTFDLWMILHKAECNSCLTHRSKYLELINSAYDENFQSMDEYKDSVNFRKRILEKISLSDVLIAIKRARSIMDRNDENKCEIKNYRNHKYYVDNPALTVWEAIAGILRDCRLLD